MLASLRLSHALSLLTIAMIRAFNFTQGRAWAALETRGGDGTSCEGSKSGRRRPHQVGPPRSADFGTKGQRKMPKFELTKLDVAIDRLLETTENPRHRFLLQAYSRHRYLEIAGRYEEIFAPDMMSMDPVYHFHQAGVETVVRGQDQVKSFVPQVGGNEPEHLLCGERRSGGCGPLHRVQLLKNYPPKQK